VRGRNKECGGRGVLLGERDDGERSGPTTVYTPPRTSRRDQYGDTALFRRGAAVRWVVAADLATRSLSALNGVLFSYVASLGLVGGYALLARNPISGSRTDVGFALLSGTFLATGTIAFYAALDRGSIAIVSAIAALYFVVPVIVGVLYFDAQLSPTNVAGLGLAVVAVVLIAS
jgi:uncharacterized membrane protein